MNQKGMVRADMTVVDLNFEALLDYVCLLVAFFDFSINQIYAILSDCLEHQLLRETDWRESQAQVPLSMPVSTSVG